MPTTVRTKNAVLAVLDENFKVNHHKISPGAPVVFLTVICIIFSITFTEFNLKFIINGSLCN